MKRIHFMGGLLVLVIGSPMFVTSGEILKVDVKPIPGIEVLLNLSVAKLDPHKPGDSYIEGIVRNRSAEQVAVPVFSGGWDNEIVLRATSRGPQDFILEEGLFFRSLRLVYWAGGKKKDASLLKPGQELSVFKDELKKVLLLEMTKQEPLKPNEKRYYWSWQA